MLSVTLTRGLPASGKSTWAKQQVAGATNGAIKRVNKDDLRAMLDVSRWSKTNEEFVKKVRDFVVIEALLLGKHVIVDDTNLEDSHYNRIRELIDQHPKLRGRVQVSYKDFTHVPIEECLRRDALRANGVGETVIRGMYKRYLAPPVLPQPKRDPSKPNAIIVDVDGTLANNTSGRGWYDHHRVDEDSLHEHIASLVQRHSNDHAIIIVSGRKECSRTLTDKWLRQHNIPFNMLLMRRDDDERKDSDVKREIYHAQIRDRYNVAFVVDDRNEVVDMWRSEGLFCLQVAEGDF